MNELVTRHIGTFPIGQRVTDGYINATVLCQAHGKLLGNYLRNDVTEAFLKALEADMRISISELVQTRKGGESNKQGTWVHPHVAINLGQWLSPQFAVTVTRWVTEWMVGKVRPHVATPQQSRVYVNRLALSWRMMMGVEEGYWTVFDKSSNLLILVECEMNMPVDHFDLLDGSVGIRWASFRKGKEWAKESILYDHEFPDRRGIRQAKAYEESELPYFNRWLRGTYIPIHLPEYLDGKYSAALPAPAKDVIAKLLAGQRKALASTN